MYFLFIGWLLVINIAGAFLMYLDKKRAVSHQWRISEKTLFAVAFLGGSLGCIFGMRLFRHKTRHLSFLLGLPFIFFLELGAFLLLLRFCSS
jgi:uncharacterized membrane protein YsdA (DUF1294 family)